LDKKICAPASHFLRIPNIFKSVFLDSFYQVIVLASSSPSAEDTEGAKLGSSVTIFGRCNRQQEEFARARKMAPASLCIELKKRCSLKIGYKGNLEACAASSIWTPSFCTSGECMQQCIYRSLHFAF